MENFGELIKQAIIEQNLTQREVADRIHVSPQTLSAYVNNRRSPSLQCFIDLVDLLGLQDSLFPPNIIEQLDLDRCNKEYYKMLKYEQKKVILVTLRYFVQTNQKEAKASIKTN